MQSLAHLSLERIPFQREIFSGPRYSPDSLDDTSLTMSGRPCELLQTSSDTFSLLSSYLTAQDLGRLWLCGSTSLNNRMVREPIEVNLVVEPGITFPLLLTLFANTQVLRASRIPDLVITSQLSDRVPLDRLPKSIHTIEFDFVDDWKHFVRYSLKSGKNHHWRVEMLDLKLLLPNLTNLTFSGDRDVNVMEFSNGYSVLREDFKLHLSNDYPPTYSLEHLRQVPYFLDQLHTNYLPEDSIISFPPHLRSLLVSGPLLANIGSFPPNLENLTVFSSDQVLRLHLPDTLRTVCLPFSRHMWEYLPHGITHLTLTGPIEDDDDDDNCEDQATEKNDDGKSRRNEETGEGQAYHGDTSNVGGKDGEKHKKTGFEPLKTFAHLRLLHFAFRSSQIPNVLIFLPPSITRVQNQYATLSVDLDDPIPPLLQSLRYERDFSDEQKALCAKSGLPTSLTALEWANPRNPFPSLPLPYLTRLVVQEMPSTPLHLPVLKELHVQEWTVGCEALKEGCFELRSLKISKSISLDTLSLLDLAWPSLASLKSLSINTPAKDVATSQKRGLWPFNMKRSSLAALSLNLGERQIPSSILRELPHSLFCLTLDPMSFIDASDMKTLPRRLSALELGGWNDQDLDLSELAPFLPKNLQSIQITGLQSVIKTQNFVILSAE